jgi:hypothetical protein
LRDAKIIAEALDGVWAHLDRIVRRAVAMAPPPAFSAASSGISLKTADSAVIQAQ